MKVFLSLLLTIFTLTSVFAADKSTKEYMEDLSNEDEAIVITAADALGKGEEKEAVTKLLELAKSDSRIKVRLHAVIALGLIKEKKSVDPLIDALPNEQNSDVRYSMVLAISRIGLESKESLDKLLAMKDKETDPYIIDYLKNLEAKLKK